MHIKNIFNIIMSLEYPNLQHVHNHHLFFCGICHQINTFEGPYDIYSHIVDKKKDNGCFMESKEEDIQKSFDEMILIKEECSNIEKINFSKTFGVIIYVYDLGRFMYQNLEKIKNKPISVLQIPLFPMETKREIVEDLNDLSLDILYPSLLCNTSYPCQHSVSIHLVNDDHKTWYSYKPMRGDQIWKHEKYLPKGMKQHFAIYDCLKCRYYK